MGVVQNLGSFKVAYFFVDTNNVFLSFPQQDGAGESRETKEQGGKDSE